uniref:Protein-tyrosine-phosphatase n=1 Tax=Ditylenchus dipsaci TaxID=166011 RepID=A0A915CPX2_9BILA
MSSNSDKGTSKLFSVCEIRPYLYISGYCALTEHKLHQLQITHAVDATNIPKTLRSILPVDDSELGDLRKFFNPTVDLVRKAKESGGKALVYCAAGISRSAALCIISLMVLESLSLEESYMEVVRTRPIIAPNLASGAK